VCGRYHITRPLEAVAEVFDAIIPEEIREAAARVLPRYNIAPTQMVPIIRWKSKAQTGASALLILPIGVSFPHGPKIRPWPRA